MTIPLVTLPAGIAREGIGRVFELSVGLRTVGNAKKPRCQRYGSGPVASQYPLRPVTDRVLIWSYGQNKVSAQRQG